MSAPWHQADAQRQCHVLSFEGSNAYARAGGIASSMIGLAQALAEASFKTPLWFLEDPDLPRHHRALAALCAAPGIDLCITHCDSIGPNI
jgi:hypothetical protein